uniref:Uncharacterized protein n=1 Tax=Globodera rostochiensis TaxID=31243 RepID=A0A914I3E4_GLORO
MSSSKVQIGQTVCDAYPYLCALSKTKSVGKRRRLLKAASTQQLLALAEICLNIVKARFALTTRQKRRMMPYADFIRRLSRSRSERGARQLLELRRYLHLKKEHDERPVRVTIDNNSRRGIIAAGEQQPTAAPAPPVWRKTPKQKKKRKRNLSVASSRGDAGAEQEEEEEGNKTADSSFRSARSTSTTGTLRAETETPTTPEQPQPQQQQVEQKQWISDLTTLLSSNPDKYGVTQAGEIRNEHGKRIMHSNLNKSLEWR